MGGLVGVEVAIQRTYVHTVIWQRSKQGRQERVLTFTDAACRAFTAIGARPTAVRRAHGSVVVRYATYVRAQILQELVAVLCSKVSVVVASASTRLHIYLI